MPDRRLVIAAAISLGFHAVVLTVVGMGLDAEAPRQDYPTTQVRFTVAGNTPAIAGIVSDSVPVPTADEVFEPVPEMVQKPVVQSVEPAMDSAITNNANSRAAGIGAPGVAASSPIIEDSEPSLITVVDPEYPIQARRLGVEGVVDLEITVDSTGLPVECRVLPPRVHKILEKSALAAVMQARFKPGMENGQPIQDTYRLKVRFELEA